VSMAASVFSVLSSKHCVMARVVCWPPQLAGAGLLLAG
jgi:hypothetical protein